MKLFKEKHYEMNKPDRIKAINNVIEIIDNLGKDNQESFSYIREMALDELMEEMNS